MSDRIATRCLMRHGAECLLYVERPLEDEDGVWMSRAGLVAKAAGRAGPARCMATLASNPCF